MPGSESSKCKGPELVLEEKGAQYGYNIVSRGRWDEMKLKKRQEPVRVGLCGSWKCIEVSFCLRRIITEKF